MAKIIFNFGIGGSLLAGQRLGWWGVTFLQAFLLTLIGVMIVVGSQYEMSFVFTLLMLSSGILFYMFMPNVMLCFFQEFQRRFKRLGILFGITSFLFLILHSLL